jgi:hypothetical protein
VEQELAQALGGEGRLAELVEEDQQPGEHGVEALAACWGVKEGSSRRVEMWRALPWQAESECE